MRPDFCLGVKEVHIHLLHLPTQVLRLDCMQHVVFMRVICLFDVYQCFPAFSKLYWTTHVALTRVRRLREGAARGLRPASRAADSWAVVEHDLDEMTYRVERRKLSTNVTQSCSVARRAGTSLSMMMQHVNLHARDSAADVALNNRSEVHMQVACKHVQSDAEWI
jgi:hypothetical protein